MKVRASWVLLLGLAVGCGASLEERLRRRRRDPRPRARRGHPRRFRSFDSVVFAGFDVALDPRNDFGSNAMPAMSIENSISFGHFDGVGYVEVDGGVDPLSNDDVGFDEIAWFENEASNENLD